MVNCTSLFSKIKKKYILIGNLYQNLKKIKIENNSTKLQNKSRPIMLKKKKNFNKNSQKLFIITI